MDIANGVTISDTIRHYKTVKVIYLCVLYVIIVIY